MVWSYDENLTRDLDKVRALVGDTDPATPRVQDEAITVALSLTQSDVVRAAAAVAPLVGAAGGAVVSKRLGEVEVRYAAPDYGAVAEALAGGALSGGSTLVAPYAGGLSLAEKKTARQDTDLPQPSFTRDGSVPAPGRGC